MASLGFKLRKFQVLLRGGDDDGRPLKHVRGNVRRMLRIITTKRKNPEK
jgi:hypothetical protein